MTDRLRSYPAAMREIGGVPSTAVTISSIIALPPWLSGVNWRPDIYRLRLLPSCAVSADGNGWAHPAQASEVTG